MNPSLILAHPILCQHTRSCTIKSQLWYWDVISKSICNGGNDGNDNDDNNNNNSNSSSNNDNEIMRWCAEATEGSKSVVIIQVMKAKYKYDNKTLYEESKEAKKDIYKSN